jgi:hypothetical protein
MQALKKIETVPFAGDLQFAIDRLRGALSFDDLIELDAPVERAIVERRAAVEMRREAEREVAAAVRRHGQPGKTPEGEKEVRATRAALERAELAAKAAAEAETRARRLREEIVLRRIGTKLETAVPTLIEIVRIANQAIGPFASLYGYSVGRQVSLPRLLSVMPSAAEAVRALTAVINFATTPNEERT